MTRREFKEMEAQVPEQPGIYKFMDEEGTLLYVGKAKRLKNRLRSYFTGQKNLSYKTRKMVRNANSIDFTIVETEHDALLLENTLIKRFQPRYNVLMRDDKSYSYICIKNERFPRVFFTRQLVRDGSTYFGPYTSKHKTKIVLDLIRSLFKLRTCKYDLSEENIEEGKYKVCLEYHIENCKGPCEGLESEEEYNKKIRQVKNILKGHFGKVKKHIKSRMKECVDTLDYEEAQRWKERLQALDDYQSRSTVVSHKVRDVDVFGIATEKKYAYVNYLRVVNGAVINTYTVELEKNLNEDEKELLTFAIPSLREKFNSNSPEVVLPREVPMEDESVKITVPQRGDKRKLLEMSRKNARYFLLQKKKEKAAAQRKQSRAERILGTLQKDLGMDRMPLHIECFDNSNVQGAHPVASCVVFKNAKPSKKDYRHFNIKTVEGPDDYASMREVVHRRYRRMLEEERDLPQLVIIDGGKGQLNAAMHSLERLGIEDEFTVIGIAKRLEEIYFPGDSVPVFIDKMSESLKLIQKIRNEAHRFAVTFHRNQRSKDFTRSALLDIPGVGEKTSERLLKHFGSIKKMEEAGPEAITSVVGPAKAVAICAHFDIREEEE